MTKTQLDLSTLKMTTGHTGAEKQLVEFFTHTFSDSEGESEGKLIGQLVDHLINTTAVEDLLSFHAYSNNHLLGSIFFSRLVYDEDARTVFMLSPVAVATQQQRQGIGQHLLKFGLDSLREKHIDIALTYGDPKYYCKVGFEAISEQTAPPPLALSYPHGWIGQTLTGEVITPLKGTPRCVSAFNNPVYW